VGDFYGERQNNIVGEVFCERQRMQRQIGSVAGIWRRKTSGLTERPELHEQVQKKAGGQNK